MTFWDETVPLSPANLNSSTVPVGGIIMYSGVIANLPENWSLCDGTGGTPDLRGRFVVGAEGSYEQGDTGGADEVTLSEGELPAHSHSGSSGSGGSHTHGLSHQVHTPVGLNVPADGNVVTKNAAGGSVTVNSAGSHSHSVTVGNTGGGEAHENRPPYYALAFVMRVA